MKFSSSDLVFLLALASIVTASVVFGFSVCFLFSKYLL